MKTVQQKAGDRWEALIRAECRALAERRRAWVDKNWEAPRVPGTSVPREASKPDFSGFVAGGRHVVFEAKTSSSTTSFAFDLLRPKQWADLQVASDQGAWAFVYLLDGAAGRWVLPFDVLDDARVSGRQSVPFAPYESLKQRGEWHRAGSAFRWSGESWLDTLERGGIQ